MRVVHVISSLDQRCGGPTTALLAMVRGQAQAGHDVTVVATWSKHQSTGIADEIERIGARVQLVGPCVGPMMWHWNLGRVLRNEIDGADLVHIHAVWEEIQHRAASVARRLGVPYIITTHGMLDPWSLSQRGLKKRLYMALRLRRDLNHASAVHFTTDIERDLTRPLHLRSQSFIEPYCLDLSEFNELPSRGQFRAQYPQIGNRKIVLFLSRLHPKKGLDLLIPAFAKAATNDAVLVLAGPVAPEYADELDRMIEQHGLRDRVIKTGMLYNGSRVAALVDADLFVLPSYQENFGIAVIEALAAGCPVVISDQVNIHRQISRAHVGAVIPTEIDALASQISHWMNDEAQRTETARRARTFALQQYDLARSERRWRRHYNQVISLAARPVSSDAHAAPAGAGVRPGMTALARHHSA